MNANGSASTAAPPASVKRARTTYLPQQASKQANKQPNKQTNKQTNPLPRCALLCRAARADPRARIGLTYADRSRFTRRAQTPTQHTGDWHYIQHPPHAPTGRMRGEAEWRSARHGRRRRCSNSPRTAAAVTAGLNPSRARCATRTARRVLRRHRAAAGLSAMIAPRRALRHTLRHPMRHASEMRTRGRARSGRRAAAAGIGRARGRPHGLSRETTR